MPSHEPDTTSLSQISMAVGPLLRVPDFCQIYRSPFLSAKVLGREQCHSVSGGGVNVMIPKVKVAFRTK